MTDLPNARSGKVAATNPELFERTKELTKQIKSIKKEVIVECALELFYKNGYHVTTIDDIAKNLGVGKPYIYNFFKSKLDILSVVAGRGTNMVYSAVLDGANISGNAENKLRQVTYAFTQCALENYKYVVVYFRENMYLPEDVKRDLKEKRIRIDEIVQGIVEEGIASGEFKSDNTYLSSISVTGMISYTFAWYRSGCEIPIETICDQMGNNAVMLLTRGVTTSK